MADSTHTPSPTPGPPDKGASPEKLSSDSAFVVRPSEEDSSSAPQEGPVNSLLRSQLDQQATVISSQKPQVGSSYSGLGNSMDMGMALEGRSLDHFKLEQFVGGGGMGAVFRATDTQLNRTVAVKVLTRRQSSAEESIRRFRNEAQSAARLDHENIARVYYVGEDDGWYFIVMEYIDGINIRDLVDQRGPTSLDDAIRYTLQMAEALDHAFHRDVVHRDIKPSNILVTAEGHTKLVDMGLARLHQVETSSNDLTASGMTLGTFDYISPEQARDPRSADVRSDLYSLGCTLYYMLTGQPPFAEGTVLQKLLSHSSDAPPDPQTLRPDLPAEMTTITQRLLAKRPLDRFQDPSELIGTLLLLADRLDLDVGASGGSVWLAPAKDSPRKWVQHLPWVVPVVLLFVVAMAGALRERSRSVSNSRASLPPFIAPEFLLPYEGDNQQPSLEPSPPEGTPSSSPGDDTRGEPTEDPTTQEEGNSGETITPAPTVDENPHDGATADNTTSEVNQPSGSWLARARLGPPPVSGALSLVQSAEGLLMSAELAASLPDLPTGSTVEGESGLPAPLSRMVIVGPEPFDDPLPHQHYVTTIAEAFDLLSSDPIIDQIELNFDGPREIPPLRLDAALLDATLTLRASSGRRPVLRFLPGIEPRSDQNHSMLTLHGGKVLFQDLRMEMIAPDDLSKDWSLFHLEGVSWLRLDRCELVIHKPGRASRRPDRNISFLLVSEALNTEFGSRATMASTQVELDLINCIVRGEATMIRMPQAVPLSLTWFNGFLTTSETLLSTGGASMRPMRGEHIRLDLEHVTAIVDEGLCSVGTNGGTHYPLALDIRCESCILLTQPGVPLISQSGNLSVEDLQSLMLYSGLRNFYEGGDTFWRIDAWADDALVDFDFEQWRSHWAPDEKRPSWGLVRWRRSIDHAIPHHLQSPSDYELSDNPGNPARGTSPDRSAGFDATPFVRPPSADTAEDIPSGAAPSSERSGEVFP